MSNFGTVHKVIDIDGTAHSVIISAQLYAYGDKATGGVTLTLIHDAARVKDYRDGLKRSGAIRERLIQMGFACETRFDAAHGRRYMLLAFTTPVQRRVVMAAADGISDLRQYHIDCGISADELDAMAAKEKPETCRHCGEERSASPEGSSWVCGPCNGFNETENEA